MAAMNDTDLYPGWQGYAYPAGAGRKAQIDAQSPSKAAGMTVAEEDTCRASASSRMGKLGMGLFLSQYTIGIAHTFFHRFFSRQSYKQHDWSLVALTSIFLASKVEESAKRLDEVVAQHFQIASPGTRVLKDSKIFQHFRTEVTKCERILLHTLAFEICVDPPQKKVVLLIRHMREADKKAIVGTDDVVSKDMVEKIKLLSVQYNDLMNAAMAFVNDSQRSTLCLQYPPHQIAFASITMANEWLSSKRPRWKTRDPKAGLGKLVEPEEGSVEEICSQMRQTLENPNTMETLVQAGMEGPASKRQRMN
jgi:hypothetical protein